MNNGYFTRITDTLHGDQYIFFIISLHFLLTMRNVSDRICRENQNIFFFNNYHISHPPSAHMKIVPVMR